MEEKKAEAIVQGLQEVSLEHIATREDIAEVRNEIANLKADIFKWLVPLLIGQAALIAALVELFK